MNKSDPQVCVSWPLSSIPETMLELVGSIQRITGVVDFGCLRPVVIDDEVPNFCLVRDTYLAGECQIRDTRETFPQNPKALSYWLFEEFPSRFSFFLGSVRRDFPGIGFGAIQVGVENNALKLTNIIYAH